MTYKLAKEHHQQTQLWHIESIYILAVHIWLNSTLLHLLKIVFDFSATIINYRTSSQRILLV